jgi:hypothetical protein
MLGVPTLELGYPVRLFVLMESDYAAVQGHFHPHPFASTRATLLALT